MNLLIENENGVLVVQLPGDHLDANNVKAFKTEIAAHVESNRKVVFDLSQLEFVDSSGLGSLLSCLRQLNSYGGDLKLSGMTKPVRTLFELVRMHRIFDIYNDKNEAVQAFLN